MSDTNLCPCGSEIEQKNCCLPFILGEKKATTAVELLRARYTAFTRGDVDFILETHHSRTRNEVKREEIEDWSKNSEWQSLQILQIEKGGAEEQQGSIVFGARYISHGKQEEHWEKSFFEKENGQWRFLDAQGVHLGTFKRTQPKTGRNDTCPCGSGKNSKSAVW